MKLTTFLGILCGLLIAVAVLLPFSACGCAKITKGSACMSNVKQQSLGMILYAEDSDLRFPPRDVWMDAIKPYVKNDAVFHDRELPKGSYGYAFNAALSRSKEPKNPEKVPMLYDSTNPAKNASDAFASLPSPGRHDGKNSIAYADGHVKRVLSK